VLGTCRRYFCGEGFSQCGAAGSGIISKDIRTHVRIECINGDPIGICGKVSGAFNWPLT
jgi:hypothetical protein